MQDRTEITETTTPTTRVNGVPRTSTEVRTIEHGFGAVDRVESVAYDPYANKRIMASRVIQLVYLVFGLIEGLILIRFVLKALGANASAGFAQFIYGVTAPLVGPFHGIFANSGAANNVFEPAALVAIAVFALVGWGVVVLIRISTAPKGTRPATS